MRLRWWPQRLGVSTLFVVTVQSAPLPPALEPWGVSTAAQLQDSSICMTLIIKQDGTIAGVGRGLGFAKHGLPGDIFGMEASAMWGRSISHYLDVFQALVQNAQLYSEIQPQTVVAQMLRQLSVTHHARPVATYRSSFMCAAQAASLAAVPDFVPCRFSVEPLSTSAVDVAAVTRAGEADPDVVEEVLAKGGYAVHVWSANWLNAEVATSLDGTIRSVGTGFEVHVYWCSLVFI